MSIYLDCSVSDILNQLDSMTAPSANVRAVSMPDLIAHTNMDSQSVSRLREELSKMTQWLAKRIPNYLSTEYEHAGQEYLESAKNGA